MAGVKVRGEEEDKRGPGVWGKARLLALREIDVEVSWRMMVSFRSHALQQPAVTLSIDRVTVG